MKTRTIVLLAAIVVLAGGLLAIPLSGAVARPVFLLGGFH